MPLFPRPPSPFYLPSAVLYVRVVILKGDYVKSLIALTDYPDFNIDGVNAAFFEWEHNKHSNIMTFRDCPHRSLMTGTG